MKIKITINESTNSTINATIFECDTSSNIGTLWMTREEFDSFTDMLRYGLTDKDSIEVVDEYTYNEQSG